MTPEIELVLLKVDKNWSRDYIIRFLYVELAPCFQRDLNFFLASYEEKLAKYKTKSFCQGTKIVCSTLADYYIKIFAMFGINARKIIATSAEIPLYALVVEGDIGYYFLDPLNDLFPNQYGLQTSYFGTIPHYKTVQKNFPYLKSFEELQLRAMDIETGIHEDGIYTSDIIKKLRETFLLRAKICKQFNLSSKDAYSLSKKKLEFINDNLINIGNVPGLFERMKLYCYLRNNLFDREEREFTDIIFDLSQPNNPHLHFMIAYPNYNKEVYEETVDENKHYTLNRIE